MGRDTTTHIVSAARRSKPTAVALVQQTCGKVRLIRTMGVLLLAARHLAKDFDQATREDL
jgi:hypothetical protein